MWQKLHKLIFVIFVGLTSIIAEDNSKDSVQVISPKKAALWALIPGGGQVYNKQYWKAGAILAAETFYIWKFNEHRINYRYYKESFPLRKSRYLEKRNKYAWWIGFTWMYGMLDAVVEAHLSRFEEIMTEDIERIKKVESEK